MSRILDVSESGYYRYIKSEDKPSRDTLVLVAIREILEEHLCNDYYGAGRMQLALAQRGMNAGVRKLMRIMRENGWLHARKRCPKGLTKDDPAAVARLSQDFPKFLLMIA